MLTFQAITTRYLGPTNVRGSRVTARAAVGRVILNWDHALNSDENHAAAAKALADKFQWGGDWYGGGLPDGKGNVYVQTLFGAEPLFTTRGERVPA